MSLRELRLPALTCGIHPTPQVRTGPSAGVYADPTEKPEPTDPRTEVAEHYSAEDVAAQWGGYSQGGGYEQQYGYDEGSYEGGGQQDYGAAQQNWQQVSSSHAPPR